MSDPAVLCEVADNIATITLNRPDNRNSMTPDVLAGFNESVEHALQGRMLELEAQIDAIEPMSSDGASPVMIGEEDGELAARIARIGGGTK